MTLNVTISVRQGQSYRAKLEVIDTYPPEATPVVASEVIIKPGECHDTYMTTTRSFKITELPLTDPS